MPNRLWRQTSALHALAVATSAAGMLAWPIAARAQQDRAPLLQVEVSDSIGLPLPDATVQVFTLMDGGVFWEWIVVGPSQLSEGINLLRFSHPGYRSSTFSVPLRADSKVALRVRLGAQVDTTTHSDGLEAREVRAVGMAIEGRMKTDVIGRRRIIEPGPAAKESSGRFGALLRRARGTELNIVPSGSAGSFRPLAQTVSGQTNCPMVVMLNGDRRQVLPFAAFDDLYGTSDVEVIEVFPRSTSLPSPYQVPKGGCGMIVVWFKSP
jgi:hypothetical protein